MRKNTLWYIPGAFFLLACVLNWIGCIQGTDLAELNEFKNGILRLLDPLKLLFDEGSAEVGPAVRELRRLMEETGAEEALLSRKKAGTAQELWI